MDDIEMCDRLIDSMAQWPWSAISRVAFVTKKCQPSGPVNFSYLQDFVNQATATKSLSSVNFSSCLSLTSSMVAWPRSVPMTAITTTSPWGRMLSVMLLSQSQHQSLLSHHPTLDDLPAQVAQKYWETEKYLVTEKYWVTQWELTGVLSQHWTCHLTFTYSFIIVSKIKLES